MKIISTEMVKKINGTRKYKKLTKQEPSNQYISNSNKANARKRIDEEVGDIYDLLADVSKRLAMLERLLMSAMDEYLNGNTIESSKREKYANMVSEYTRVINEGIIKDRVDIEDEHKLFNKLMVRFNKIANIVETEMK